MKSFYILFVTLTLLTLGSCEKFLETEPSDFLAPSTYFNSEKELNNALTGVYDVLGSTALYGDYVFYQYDITDEGVYGHAGVTNGVQVYNFASSNTVIDATWTTLYNGIGRANLLLENIDKPEMNENKRDAIEGEALFLRAYYYFLLAQMWGDVPLILETTKSADDTQRPRTPLAQVYEQILNDLKKAESLVLPITALNFSGRANKSAVRGMLARVCLHMAGYPLKDHSKYAEAKHWAAKVINDTEAGHALNQSYEQVFINLAADKYDIKESLFEVEFWGNRSDAYTESGRLGTRNGIRCLNPDLGYSLGRINATPRFYQRFEEEDKRRDWNIAPFIYPSANSVDPVYWAESNLWQRSCGKYRRMYEVVKPQSTSFSPINYPIMRYADILLMFAEADNELTAIPSDSAVNFVNLVRRRGFGLDMTVPGIADVSSGDRSSRLNFQAFLRDERSRELCFEGLRKGDLIRWEQFLSEMRAAASEIDLIAVSGYKFEARAGFNVSEKNYLFPIPSNEMSLNRMLKQNPGW